MAAAMTLAEQFWWVAPSVATFAALLIIWFNWGQHKVRALRMKRGFDAFLTLFPEKGRETWCHELHVPPNTTIAIQLRIVPRLSFKQFLFVFGFGDGDKDSRPLPKRVLNKFIKVGMRREQSPETNENHHIDYVDNYHIREQMERVVPNTYAYGFEVQTRAPGRYPAYLRIITDCGEARPRHPLVLVVETR